MHHSPCLSSVGKDDLHIFGIAGPPMITIVQIFTWVAIVLPSSTRKGNMKATDHVINFLIFCHSTSTDQCTEQVINNTFSVYGFDECLLKLILSQKDKYVGQTCLRDESFLIHSCPFNSNLILKRNLKEMKRYRSLAILVDSLVLGL